MQKIIEIADLVGKTINLRDQLKNIIHSSRLSSSDAELDLSSFNVVITPNEVNERHGTGVLVRKLFPDSSNIISVRSRDTYSGDHSFGVKSFCLSYSNMTRPQIFAELLERFALLPVKRILCIPLYPDDVLTAIVLKELFDAPLCTYLMDDQNIYSDHIPNSLMKELLTKSSLRLAISPEMRDAYENKYGLKIWIVPPLVSSDLVLPTVAVPHDEALQVKKGVLIGNVWSQVWLDLLRKTIKESNFTIDWFGNNSSRWLDADQDKWREDGIVDHGFLEQEQAVAQHLRQYPYAIVPSSSLDQDSYESIGKLSLPSRIPFILATSNTPIIVIGSPKTAAAQFVEHFGIGVVCKYDSSSFQKAVDYVCEPEQQLLMRQKAATLASSFTASGIENWIWRSLELGEPCSAQFEELFPRGPGDLTYFIEPPVPKEIFRDFIPIYQSIRRLVGQGFQPDFVLDVGSSVGVWSHVVSKLVSDARFILVDPLMSRYNEGLRSQFLTNHANFELVEVAISNQAGQTTFQVSPDLYGSSLLHPADFREYEPVDVEVTTLDELARKRTITGRGLLKIDVQCAEHLVIEGAKLLMPQIDAVVLELSLVRYDERAKDFAEMIQMLSELGFRYYDDIGCWRSPVDGALLQKDALFLREGLYLPETRRL